MDVSVTQLSCEPRSLLCQGCPHLRFSRLAGVNSEFSSTETDFLRIKLDQRRQTFYRPKNRRFKGEEIYETCFK